MRHAPSVSYPVGRSVWAGRILLMLACLSLLVQGWWLYGLFEQTRGNPVAAASWGFMVWVLWSIWALRSWLTSASGTLHWYSGDVSDKGWFWQSRRDAAMVRLSRAPVLIMDAQWVLLLRLSDRWLWVDRQDGDSDWLGLRRALRAGDREPSSERMG